MNTFDYQQTGYSAGGGQYDGGFMNNDSFGSQGSQDGTKKRAGNNSTRPVTIRQILTASHPHADDDFRIDGAEIGHLTFVGVVRNIQQSSTSASIKIEDGTGDIDVKQWSDTADEDNSELRGITTDTYVRVIGDLKSFNNKRHLYGLSIRKIEDFNEIFYHLLEAQAIHLYYTRGPLTSDSDARHTNGDVEMSNADPTERELAQANLQGQELQAMRVLHQDNIPHEGLHFRQIAQLIKERDSERVYDMMQRLCEKGCAYTSVDEEHFCTSLKSS